MGEPSWRKIADGLAERLMHHAYCGERDHDPGAEPDICPFCADIAAYDAYVAKGGTVRLNSFNEAVLVNVSDLWLSP
jgi:hypothetical protein